jgi:hypothetical protein
MKHVALVTDVAHPTLSQSDQILAKSLENERIIFHQVAWDNNDIDWSLFDGIVLRSCWNYPTKYTQFLQWLSLLEQIKANVWNPTKTLQWNTHKKYLFELQEKGIPIIPSAILDPGNTHIFGNDFIIKPAISNRSIGVLRSPKNIQTLTKKGDYLIQPYIQEVTQTGEYSFVFIGGKLCHTICKTQKEVLLITPDTSLIRQASAVLDTIDTFLLYARVDGIEKNGKLMLMELELIEPNLYFDKNPSAAVVFARILNKRL